MIMWVGLCEFYDKNCLRKGLGGYFYEMGKPTRLQLEMEKYSMAVQCTI